MSAIETTHRSSSPSPIFVIGTGRSGTTLLRCMLSAHPRIYITHEAEFYRLEAHYPRRASGREFLSYYFQTGSFRWLKVDPRRVLEGLPDPLPRKDIHLAFTALMREKAAAYGRPRFGDKTPAHSRHVSRILADYPDARIIYIVRDPRAAVVSLTQMPWASPSVYANSVYCELDWRAIKRFDKHLSIVRLEDLLRDAEPTMRRVLEHVGEPWDDAVLDHARHHPDKHDMPPYPWLESSVSAPTVAATPKWSSLSPLEIRLIEDVTRRSMREAGYERAALPQGPGKLEIVAAELRQVPAILRTVYLYWRMGRIVRDAAKLESPELAALFKCVNPGSWARYPGFEMPVPPALPA